MVRGERTAVRWRWLRSWIALAGCCVSLAAHATITIDIVADKALAIVGQTVQLTVTVRNTGAGPLTSDLRIFQLVAGSEVQAAFTQFVSAAPAACGVVTLTTASGPLDVLSCSITNLAVNATRQFVIQVATIKQSRGGIVPLATVNNEAQTASVQVDVVADTVTDTDHDGVSDFNETLAGTDPASAASVPGNSVIDVLVLYSSGAAALYGGDPGTRINHLITVMNAIFANSGVRASFRIAASQQVAVSDAVNNTVALEQMLARSGVFADIDARRSSARADTVLLFRPFVTGSDNCGFASVLAVGMQGDLGAQSDVQSAFGTVHIDCRDRTTAHETGHIMGLGHDRRDVASLGTFAFSRGYGVDNQFVDVMGVAPLYAGNVQEVDLFSSPTLLCLGLPCGVDRTATNSADAAFSLETVRFQVARFIDGAVLDIDANGVAQPLTDGILLVRALFNFSGTTLTAGALGGGATRTSSGDILAHISSNLARLDVDRNNATQPLTDGVLAVRYLFGFRGSALINGAVGANAAATTSTAIEANLAAISQ